MSTAERFGGCVTVESPRRAGPPAARRPARLRSITVSDSQDTTGGVRAAELARRPPGAGVLLGLDPGADGFSEEEASYARASKAPATVAAYRSDWAEFDEWCHRQGHQVLPAPPAAVSGYLTALARAGAKVSTMSRRMAAIRFFHALQDRACHDSRVSHG